MESSDPRDRDMVRVRLRIYGIVQGVYFRANMRRVAKALGVTGWVRNVPDGSVEAVAEGRRDAVEELVKWSLRGPPAAVVEKVVVEFEPYKGEFKEFTVRY